MMENGFTAIIEAYLSDPETFQKIADAAGFKGGGGDRAAEIVTLDKDGLEIGKVENPHPELKTIVSVLMRIGVYLFGPKGSGKSTIMQQAAEALGVRCYVQGRVESAFEIFGFRDGRGEYRRTAFRDAFEHGGVYCLDEMDRCDPTAVTALNDALSSGRALFPDGETIRQHEAFYFGGTGNTAGRGEEVGYSAAVEHDSAVLDRLACIKIDYDSDFERSLIPARFGYWVDRVLALRSAIEKVGAQCSATPRASIKGAQLLHDGIKQADVEDMLIFKGLDASTVDTIKREAARGEED
jgi:cobaltochelatase CobS